MMTAPTEQKEPLEKTEAVAAPLVVNPAQENSDSRTKLDQNMIKELENLSLQLKSLKQSATDVNRRDIDSWATRLGATAVFLALLKLDQTGISSVTGWGIYVVRLIVLVMTFVTLLPLLSFTGRVWDRKTMDLQKFLSLVILLATAFAILPLTLSIAADTIFRGGLNYIIGTVISIVLLFIFVFVSINMEKKHNNVQSDR